MSVSPVPVIAIDGPSASGKGTVAARVAEALGYHYLESGALYRLIACQSLARDVPPFDEAGLAMLAAGLVVEFQGGKILLENHDVTEEMRSEACGNRASEIAQLIGVRAALLERQRAFRRPPGLVADGRDMGTVVFPDARLKVFLTASVEERARRRYKQLIDKGIHANLAALSRELEERDRRDATRAVAPLRPAQDAVQVDSSALSVDQVVDLIVKHYRARMGGKA